MKLSRVDFDRYVPWSGGRSPSDTVCALDADKHGVELEWSAAEHAVIVRRGHQVNRYPFDVVLRAVEATVATVTELTSRPCIICGAPHARSGQTCSQKCGAVMRQRSGR